MLKILETKVHSVNKNKYEELRVSFLIKKEDYTPEIEQEFFRLSRDGECGALVFQWVENFEKVDRNKLLQDLWFFMIKYIEKVGGSIEQEKQRIYKKYKIKSRTEMTHLELQYEIDSYKAWLNYDE